MLVTKIKQLLKQKNAVLIAHYYVDKSIQKLAIETGGIVADSLEMARFGAQHKASTLLVAGVRFMGETAKILSPDKTVIMPTIKATCSLDEGCNTSDFKQWVNNNPGRVVVVYANTSAAIKAEADWVVTSSIAVDVVKMLAQKKQKILWAPDYHLGSYIKQHTNADMLIWPGKCIVHDEFKAKELLLLKEKHPEAAVLVHPESPQDVIALADVVGSTKKMLNAVKDMPQKEFIVATDSGIFFSMQSQNPEKTIIAAPSLGENSACKACGRCPWMQMNNLELIEQALTNSSPEIKVAADLAAKAKIALNKMLDFA